ncbi:AAA family ATPase [Vibrio rumoiensis]|uniref:AAA family ATPase n=1 Tax=Vibrio rumoiensis TaxID=76258 RepID=UPI003AA909B7
MNETISLKGVTSYHPSEPEVIDISKQNTFIFGLNGTGKSTISNFLYAPQQQRFTGSNLNIEGDYTAIVYNQAFVDDNFVHSSIQEGVFTLSEDNAALEVRITEKTRLREQLAEAYRDIKNKISDAGQAKKDIVSSTIEEVFKQKHAIEKTSLNTFLTGFKRKVNFYDQVKKQKGNASDSIDSLDSEYQSLTQNDKAQPNLVTLPSPPKITDEQVALLSEPIVGSSSSQLTEFIAELNNQNWVKNGKDNYLKDSQTKCPFCQQDTIDDTFRSELASLFDKTYESNVQKVETVLASYTSAVTSYIDSIKAAFINCSIFDSNIHNVEPALEIIERAYQDNVALIQSKVDKPSYAIELLNCSEKLKPIEDIAKDINKSVQSIIAKAKKFNESKNDIQFRMWNSIRYHTGSLFSLEKNQIDKKDKEIEQFKDRLSRVERIGKKVTARVKYLRSKTSDIDKTITRININLKNLGLTSFEIVPSNNPEQKNYFVLSRGEESKEGEAVFKSLSEGEKTLITFLYFIEKCNGSMSADSDLTDNEKLIVIDDPISSLSQNYIYDIASLIQTKIIKGNKFKKVIVLTHSLFFYQELLKLAPNKVDQFEKKYALYRLNKKQYSIIQPMSKGELKNDYQSLWQTVKDVIDGNAHPVVLPNVMRNIIEYYFGFVHKKDKLADILNELIEKEQEQGYKSFYRYINRGSHADPTNIGIMVDVDHTAYLERFRAIFRESQDEEHYICMMES